LKDARASAIEKIGEVIAERMRDGSLVGLGSGTTMASLFPVIAKRLKRRAVKVSWVPTSLQISLVAQSMREETSMMDRPALELVVDGADQVDADLNLIKGGGGALFREKVLIANTKKTVIVVDEKKLAAKLCQKEVRVPVEAHPFARVPVAEALQDLGGEPRLRLGDRGFPFYTENGNLIFDTAFKPISKPSVLEREIKSVAGVVESGIFTPRPIDVYVIKEDGSFDTLQAKSQP
jgi:ribose 5-phosphate isomerase A